MFWQIFLSKVKADFVGVLYSMMGHVPAFFRGNVVRHWFTVDIFSYVLNGPWVLRFVEGFLLKVFLQVAELGLLRGTVVWKRWQRFEMTIII